jgi:hypothetical protein
MILKYISLPIFIVSLAIGLLFVYAYGADIKTVYIYPTPENIQSILYKDSADNCYSYQAKEVTCTGDAKSAPIQQAIDILNP